MTPVFVWAGSNHNVDKTTWHRTASRAGAESNGHARTLANSPPSRKVVRFSRCGQLTSAASLRDSTQRCTWLPQVVEKEVDVSKPLAMVLLLRQPAACGCALQAVVARRPLWHHAISSAESLRQMFDEESVSHGSCRARERPVPAPGSVLSNSYTS